MGPRLIRREDEDVSLAIQEILEAEGIRLRLNAKCIGFSKRGEEIIAHLDCDDLGLDKAGVELDQRGYIVVDDQLRTSVPGIWAMGDCNGRGAFAHTSFDDSEIVAANLLDNDPRRITDRIPAYAL